VRDRASFAFALISVARIIQRDGTGPRGLGRRGAQTVARGGSRGRDAARRQSSRARLLAGAKPTPENAFKLKLVERALASVLAEAKGA
jgi:xanthine dehydrogenase YagS FAD-binding subunit